PPLPRFGGAVRRTASRQGADRGRPRLPLPQRTTFGDRGNSGGVRSSRRYPPRAFARVIRQLGGYEERKHAPPRLRAPPPSLARGWVPRSLSRAWRWRLMLPLLASGEPGSPLD